jgi:broad specificity phosphatase PhoE
MRLHLIRHAVTAETGKRLSSKDPAIPLSAAGRQMARVLAEHLATVEFQAIYTSPMARCRQTVAPLATERGIRIRIDKSFVEADYGKWLGRPLPSVFKLKAWGSLMAAPSRFRFPDGDTLREVQSRAVAAVERLADKHQGESVAVGSHADVIRVILAQYLGTPLDLIHRINVLPASVSIVELHPAGHVLVPVVNHVVDPGMWR